MPLKSRRSDDPPDFNFDKVRSGSSFTYDRWIAKVVGAGLIALLAFYATKDRTSIDEELKSNQTQISSHEVQIQLIKSRQDRVLEDLKVIQSSVNTNNDKLDRVLLELRKIK
jgi:uncharacterized protein YoxC